MHQFSNRTDIILVSFNDIIITTMHFEVMELVMEGKRQWQ